METTCFIYDMFISLRKQLQFILSFVIKITYHKCLYHKHLSQVIIKLFIQTLSCSKTNQEHVWINSLFAVYSTRAHV